MTSDENKSWHCQFLMLPTLRAAEHAVEIKMTLLAFARVRVPITLTAGTEVASLIVGTMIETTSVERPVFDPPRFRLPVPL